MKRLYGVFEDVQTHLNSKFLVLSSLTHSVTRSQQLGKQCISWLSTKTWARAWQVFIAKKGKLNNLAVLQCQLKKVVILTLTRSTCACPIRSMTLNVIIHNLKSFTKQNNPPFECLGWSLTRWMTYWCVVLADLSLFQRPKDVSNPEISNYVCSICLTTFQGVLPSQ